MLNALLMIEYASGGGRGGGGGGDISRTGR